MFFCKKVRETTVELWHGTIVDAIDRRKRAIERRIRRFEMTEETDEARVAREARREEAEQKAAEDQAKKREEQEKVRQALIAAEMFGNAALSSPSPVRSSDSSRRDSVVLSGGGGGRASSLVEEKHRLQRESYGISSAASGGGEVDVEKIMERRRQAQIEAEKILKQEKERRAQEEQERAIQNEAIVLGLPRLIAIRGESRPRAVLVPCKASSLNLATHFVLETEEALFHFKPPKADVGKLKYAVKAIAALRKERLKKVRVVSMKKYDEPQPEFWEALGGGSPADVKDQEQKESDWESHYDSACRFYRYDKDVGLLPEPEMTSSDLDASSSFVVVTPSEFYVWFGSNVGLNQRKVTEQKAVEDIGWEVDKWVRLVILQQGKEPFLFQEKFASWELHVDIQNSTPTTQRKKVSDAQIARMMAFDPDLVPVVDDVYGTTEMWLASDFAKVPVSKQEMGTFHNANSYIVLYHGTRDTVIYFWQGSKSTTLWSHARESILEVQNKVMEARRAGSEKIPIIRLMEGDEPPHFLGIFNGRMLVRNGAHGDLDTVMHYLSMFHVRGFNLFNTRTIECSPTASLLNSDDAFVVHDTKTVFVWKGTHVSEFAYDVAQHIAKHLPGVIASKVIIVNETLEPPTFWKVLGGKKEYTKHRQPPPGCPPDRLKPRLFIYSKGNVLGKSAVLFSLLRPHDQVVLDVWDKVFVWSGRFSPSKDSFFALQVAQTYLKKSNRDDVKVVEVKDMSEPLDFIRCFSGWQYPEEKLVAVMSKEAVEVREVVKKYTNSYTLQQLQDKSSLPLTLNFNKLEQYLDEVEFVEVFGMPKAAWYKQPAWKRTEQKKEKGLF